MKKVQQLSKTMGLLFCLMATSLALFAQVETSEFSNITLDSVIAREGFFIGNGECYKKIEFSADQSIEGCLIDTAFTSTFLPDALGPYKVYINSENGEIHSIMYETKDIWLFDFKKTQHLYVAALVKSGWSARSIKSFNNAAMLTFVDNKTAPPLLMFNGGGKKAPLRIFIRKNSIEYSLYRDIR